MTYLDSFEYCMADAQILVQRMFCHYCLGVGQYKIDYVTSFLHHSLNCT